MSKLQQLEGQFYIRGPVHIYNMLYKYGRHWTWRILMMGDSSSMCLRWILCPFVACADVLLVDTLLWLQTSHLLHACSSLIMCKAHSLKPETLTSIIVLHRLSTKLILKENLCEHSLKIWVRYFKGKVEYTLNLFISWTLISLSIANEPTENNKNLRIQGKYNISVTMAYITQVLI